MPESPRSSLIGQLLDLREVTRLTGTLDELQVKNLTSWGRVAFPGKGKFGLTWDGAKRVVEYDIAGNGAFDNPPEHWDRMLEALNTSVKELLGPEWLLSIKYGPQTIFTGPRKLSFKPVEVEPLVPPRGDPDVK